MKPRVLFGPYGTVLKEIAQKSTASSEVCSEIQDPCGILYSAAARNALWETIGAYLTAGATIATTPTFGSRNLLHNGNHALFADVLKNSWELLQRSIPFPLRKKIWRFINLGPVFDCYKPEEAPHTREAQDFHSEQIARSVPLAPDALLFEAVNSIREAVGIALAAQRYATRIPTIISFVLGKDSNLLSSEPIADAIRAVRAEAPHTEIHFGLNCCPVSALQPAMSKISGSCHTKTLLAIYPNAAKDPTTLDGTPHIHKLENPQRTAQDLHLLAQKFATQIIGGCCGFDPSTVGQLAFQTF